MIKRLVFRALNSWVTSLAGVGGGYFIFLQPALEPLFDEDPATLVDWKGVIYGVIIAVLGLLTRDHTKAWIKEPTE